MTLKNPITLIVIALTSLLMSFNMNTEVNWLTNYKEAIAQSEKENKPVLMLFSGSDWCSNCIRLETTVFGTSAFQEYAKSKLILLKLDFPVKKKNKLSPELTTQNETLAEKYNKEGAFPSVILLNSHEEVIGTTGYKSIGVEEYIVHLDSFLK